MIDGLNEYLDHIRAEYARWAGNLSSGNRDEFVREFNDRLQVVVGSKFIKVVSGGSAHSFICLHDMGKFTKGDILKAASWAAPAKNFSRGNTMARNFGTISWTGA